MELWDHQRTGAAPLLKKERCALWWDMRTGKTRTAIAGSADGDRLIVCPNSVKSVWLADLASCGDTDSWIYSKTKRPASRPRNVIVNYESLWRTDLLELQWDSVIFDESHRLANFRTKLYSAILRHIQELCKSRVILLSGTPCPEGFHQLVGQSVAATGHYDGITDPWEALRTFWTYDDRKYKWVPNAGTNKRAKEILHEMGTTMTQQQAGVLTRKLYRLVEVPAGARELLLWKEMCKDELEGSQYGLAAQSAASGRDMDGNTTGSTKLDTIVEYTTESDFPIVILCRFTSSLDYLLSELAKQDITTGAIHGDDDGSEGRKKVIAAFNAGSARVLVANITTVKVGMNLSKSSCLIFAENDYSGEARIQAEERCTVRGKEAVEILDFCTVADVPGLGEVDKAILSVVRGKKTFNHSALTRPPRK